MASSAAMYFQSHPRTVALCHSRMNLYPGMPPFGLVHVHFDKRKSSTPIQVVKTPKHDSKFIPSRKLSYA
jgi:hypothetical protein